MDMRFEHTTIQAETPCGTCRTSFTAEGEVAIPGSLREATHVLHTSATAVVESADALQGRISVRGRVIFCVIYTQGAQTKAESIEATADFTHLCDAPGTVERAEAEARAWVEHAEARVQNGRMMMRANVRLYARADAVQSIEVLTTVDSPYAQTQQERISMLQTTARGSGEALVREEFTLPPELAITDTLAAWGSIRTDDVAGGQGRVSLSGEMTLEALHTSSLPGRPLVMTRHTLPVSEAVEITGNAGEELHGRMQVKDVAAASLDMGEGERTLRVEALLGLKAWSTRLESLEALSDAYTVSGEEVRLGRQELLLQTGTRCMHAAESGRAPLLALRAGTPRGRVYRDQRRGGKRQKEYRAQTGGRGTHGQGTGGADQRTPEKRFA